MQCSLHTLLLTNVPMILLYLLNKQQNLNNYEAVVFWCLALGPARSRHDEFTVLRPAGWLGDRAGRQAAQRLRKQLAGNEGCYALKY